MRRLWHYISWYCFWMWRHAYLHWKYAQKYARSRVHKEEFVKERRLMRKVGIYMNADMERLEQLAAEKAEEDRSVTP